MVNGNIKGAPVPVFDGKFLLSVFAGNQTSIAPDSIVGMYDEVFFVELIKFGSKYGYVAKTIVFPKVSG